LARENKIVSGDKNGTFKPTQPVTGVELIGVLPIAAEFRLSAGMQPIEGPVLRIRGRYLWETQTNYQRDWK